MILNLINSTLFGQEVKMYSFTEVNEPEITGIKLNDKELQINNENDIQFAIDFLKDCYVDNNAEETAFAKALIGSFIMDPTALVKAANDKIDKIIEMLSTMKMNLIKAKYIAPKVEVPENKMLNIARTYMDEVIDPKGIMAPGEYNKLLAMFTMYSEWVMQR